MKRHVYRFENRDGDVILSVTEKPLFRDENIRYYCGETYPAGQYLWRRKTFAGDVVVGRLAEWLTFEANAQKLREGSEKLSETIRDIRKALNEKKNEREA